MGREGLTVNCIKCGVEMKNAGVFCPKCLEGMEKDPVQENIVVQLPARPAPAPVKKKAKKVRFEKPEDQIRHLKSQLRWTYLVLFVALAAFVLTAGMLLQVLNKGDEGFNIGQNYETIASSDPT